MQKSAKFVRTIFELKHAKDKSIVKLGTIAILQGNEEVLHIAVVT